jgi:hypothetical protein
MSSVEGSDLSNLSGGPPAVPRKRIWVRETLATGAAVSADAIAMAAKANEQRRTIRPDMPLV